MFYSLKNLEKYTENNVTSKNCKNSGFDEVNLKRGEGPQGIFSSTYDREEHVVYISDTSPLPLAHYLLFLFVVFFFTLL